MEAFHRNILSNSKKLQIHKSTDPYVNEYDPEIARS